VVAGAACHKHDAPAAAYGGAALHQPTQLHAVGGVGVAQRGALELHPPLHGLQQRLRLLVDLLLHVVVVAALWWSDWVGGEGLQQQEKVAAGGSATSQCCMWMPFCITWSKPAASASSLRQDEPRLEISRCVD
jgi:hypothetical protein